MRKQEFVVVGYTQPTGSRVGLGALALAARDAGGELRYVGRVGTGFSDSVLRELYSALRRRSVPAAPVTDPPRGAAARGLTWVGPALVVEVAFTEWTTEGVLRHPSFQGIREDNAARDVWIEREEPVMQRGSKAGKRARERAGGATAAARTALPRNPRAGGRRGGRTESVEFAGVELTNPFKVMYSAQGITKLDLARYYMEVADWILPHISGRPLTLVRCPSGHDECFYQKHISGSAAAPIRRVRVAPDARPYGAVEDAAGLVGLVQMGVLEVHTWGSRRDRLEQPDRITFDLDPDVGLAWGRVVDAAHEVRGRLAELGLESFVKTTGGKGLHVVVPIRRRRPWDEVKAFSRAVVAAIEMDSPGRYTLNTAKPKRQGRILLDYLRNGRGATAVEAFSTRARPGAPVAVPVRWEELGPKLRSDRFDIFRARRRLASLRSDPWEGYTEVRQSVTARMMRAAGVR